MEKARMDILLEENRQKRDAKLRRLRERRHIRELGRNAPSVFDHDAYLAYLQTKAWQEKRHLRLDIDENRCQNCGAASSLQVHHLTYERLFEENMSDLLTLCAGCHEQVTLLQKSMGITHRKATVMVMLLAGDK